MKIVVILQEVQFYASEEITTKYTTSVTVFVNKQVICWHVDGPAKPRCQCIN